MKKLFTCAITLILIPVCSSASSTPDSFADLVEKLNPTVVNISTTQTIEGIENPLGSFTYQLPEGSPLEGLPDLLEKFYGQQGEEGGNPVERKATSLGSGFIIDPDGYIVTNYHVIEKAEEITVTLFDETKLSAKVVGRDSKTDLALLKVNTTKKLPFAKWGDSDKTRVGDWVIAIGNPFGLGGSVSAGIISARARDINSGPFDDFLQTDAAINRGNSGGPLFNTEGEVIGVNTAIFSPSGGNVGIGFATPSSMADNVIEQIKDIGRVQRSRLGVKIQTVTEDIANSLGLKEDKGALVLDIDKGSPAEKAGIESGDVIMEFDGHEISTMRKLPRIVAETPINKKVPINLWRKGKKITLVATVDELKEDVEKAKVSKTEKEEKTEKEDYHEIAGIGVVEITPKNRSKYQLDDKSSGLLIVDVKKDSSAAEKGLMRGDIIVSANQEKLSTVNDFEKVVKKAKDDKRSSILLLVDRGGETMFIAVKLSNK